MTAADLFISGLRRSGVEFMATLCGHGLDPLFQAALGAGLRLVDTRNEQTAAYIADAYGRLTRRPGVCAVSSGVALINALTGAANAWFDGAPMVVISGAGNLASAGLGHFQDMDQAAMARAVTKFSRVIDTAPRTLQILEEALWAAGTDPRGPTHLMFPMDVQNTAVAEADIVPPARLHPVRLAPDDDPALVEAALAASCRPLAIAGSGLFYDGDGQRMLDFCAQFQIPVVTPIWDRGVVARPGPAYCGVIGAASGGPALLADADCILLAGAEVDYRVGYLQPPAVRADARVFRCGRGWDALAAACSQPDAARVAWLAECVRRRDEFRAGVERGVRRQSGALHAVDVMQAIGAVLGADPVLLIDGGSIGQWAHQLLCADRYPGDWLTCGRSGVVGWGIGGAMAARLAFPERPVILLSGDGAFTFNVADLECAVRQKLPFVAVVADDQGWGITRSGHERQFGQPIASSLGPIAFDRLAESLGARGVRVSTDESLRAELRRAMETPEVTVIHVPISGGNPSATSAP